MYKNVMIVDDELLEAKCLMNAIEWEKYNLFVTNCVSGAEAALKALETERIDVIISDIRMPKKNGIELCEEVREKYPDVVFIFLSAYKDFEYARSAISYQVFDYITKPLDFDQLEKLCINLQNHFKKFKTDYPTISTQILHFQQILTDFLSGKIPDVKALSDTFAEKTLIKNYTSGNCAYINVHIEDFMDFLTRIWDFGTDKAYAYIINSMKHDEALAIPLSYSFDSIELAVISLSAADLNEALSEICCNAEQKCEEDISLKININIITFFEKTEDMRTAGLIKKFVPEINKNTSQTITSKAKEYINNNYMRDISLFDIAEHVELTPYYFSRIFKKETGSNFSVYLTERRIEKAKELLKETDKKNSEICKMIGINNTNYFYSVFKKHTGYSPVEYRSICKKD